MALLAAATLGACAGGGGQAAPDQWGAAAQEWRAAFYEAAAEGRTNVLNFLAEDVVFEDRIIGGEIHGWQDFLAHDRSMVGDIVHSHPAAMFVSAEGFLDQYYWQDVPLTADLLDRVEVQGPVAATSVGGGSLAGAREYVPDRRDFDVVERLADRYVAAWNGEEDAATVYAADARIEDTLLGLSVDGMDEIAAVVGGDEGLDPPPLHIPDLPAHPEAGGSQGPAPGRAIYVSPSDLPATVPDEVRILLEADDGSGCPGLLAVSLEVEGDVVLAERRYHEVESVRACRDVATLQPGWWEGIEVPDPVRVEETDPMVWPERGLSVEIYNGSPEITAFVRWGLERYDDAGLELPDIGSVTFLTSRSSCGGDLGFYAPRPGPDDVTLCRTVDRICGDAACNEWSPVARHTLLHEYAHAWMSDHLDADRQQQLLRLTGLERWNDGDDAWGDRGMERAAEMLAFGLLGNPRHDAYDETTRCEHSLEGFRLLTGREPLTSCP